MSPSRLPADAEWLLDVERRVAEISGLADPAHRRQAVAAAASSLDRSTVRRLFEEVAREAHVDAERAAAMVDLTTRVADLLDDDTSRGLAHKAAAFLLYLKSDYEAAPWPASSSPPSCSRARAPSWTMPRP